MLSGRQQFEGMKERLESRLRIQPQDYEMHVRQKFEPMFMARRDHIMGLYQFVRQDIEQPLSGVLCLEWLDRFPELPLQVVRELVECLLRSPEEIRTHVWSELSAIVAHRLENCDKNSEEEMYWRSIQFLVDFDSASSFITDIAVSKPDWLWTVSDSFSTEYGSETRSIPLSIAQLKWIASTFRTLWPHSERPGGVTSGSTNPWDATNLLLWSIKQISKSASDAAAEALFELRDMPLDGYTIHIQAAIAAQHRTKMEAKFKSPQISEFKAVLDDGPPQSVADVQAVVLDKFDVLKARLRGDALDRVDAYYREDGTPKEENECRTQMLIHLETLPFNIQAPIEVAMPRGKRSDAAFVFGQFAIPLEAKGQWHKDVWTAAKTQLDRFYSIEHKSASKGIYVVFWFGEAVPKSRKLKAPPDKALKPASSEEMELALRALIPQERRDDIAVVVLDLTRP